jgi:tRNA (guanine37-N1)-methyltransferase
MELEDQMKAAVVTLFPELFEQFLNTSFLKKAQEVGQLQVHLEWLRQHGLGRHRSIDDTPYGGGSGMVMRVDCVLAAVEAAEAQIGGRSRRILLTPQGRRFDQPAARRLAGEQRVVLVCGRYEGFDERVRSWCDEELSLGDFVMTGGEVAAMAVLEATVRLLPGVLGNEESILEESFSPEQGGMLEYPHYTRPVEFRGAEVPEVLRSGDHARIASWRRQQSLLRTQQRRGDLLPTTTEGEP